VQGYVTLSGGERQDYHQVRWAGVEEINREDKDWSSASLLTATGRAKISEPDLAAVWISHTISNSVA
jgi:hypothetical protein